MQGSILNEIYQIQSLLSKRGGRETLLAKNLDTDELVVVIPLTSTVNSTEVIK